MAAKIGEYAEAAGLGVFFFTRGSVFARSASEAVLIAASAGLELYGREKRDFYLEMTGTETPQRWQAASGWLRGKKT